MNKSIIPVVRHILTSPRVDRCALFPAIRRFQNVLVNSRRNASDRERQRLHLGQRAPELYQLRQGASEKNQCD